MRNFKACFRTGGPLQTCGPELKTKLHDPFEPFSASYHVLVMNRVSEVLRKNQHTFQQPSYLGRFYLLGVFIQQSLVSQNLLIGGKNFVDYLMKNEFSIVAFQSKTCESTGGSF